MKSWITSICLVTAAGWLALAVFALSTTYPSELPTWLRVWGNAIVALAIWVKFATALICQRHLNGIFPTWIDEREERTR